MLSAGNWQGVQNWLNTQTSWVVWRKSVDTNEVGNAVNYIAVEAMTDANRGRITTFYTMNPVNFDPSRADIRSYWDNTFSGALGGQGQATRDALTALWRRTTNNVEKLLSTGTGTTASPALLSFEGTISTQDAISVVYKPDGVTVWQPGE
jgi:hypothetical protein